MYENLIETLRFCAKNGNCHDCPYEKPCAGTMGDGLYCEAADAIEEQQQQIDAWVEPERKALIKSLPKWIPVTEKLPEENGYYLTYVESPIFPNRYYPNMIKFIDGDFIEDHCVIHRVTHWMPLPEPPKDGT